ncbi:YchJ family protein [Thalassotalea sp. LPB0316]|uniref:YchJ family protein n=1 Tax=Thalassotalea sp. LPB0316 TaxID=2769490 RepID=UPI001867D714|nr:YchJ family protein [Thalassotalea sp. LPB0316]QOL25162.1 YchJ family protein [Thalassotalea sp. LPB0316]
MKCPCQSGYSYDNCCQALHLDQVIANSPEQLMRSRYSAYALSLGQYLYNTYHSEKQTGLTVDELEQWARATTWLKLEINQTTESTVTFTATYTEAGQLYQIQEHSRFTQEHGAWRYVDGDILVHQQLPKPKRNEKCPCGSLKKLKQCCGVRSNLL